MLKDPTTFSSSLGVPNEPTPLLSELDRPEHDRIRRPMLFMLSRRAVEGITPGVRAACGAAVDRLPAPGGVELIGALVAPVLHDTIARLIGVPHADRDLVFGWAGELTDWHFTGDALGDTGRLLDGYLTQLVRSCRDSGTGTGVHRFVAAGARERPPLTDPEITVQVRSLVMAGHGATLDLLGILLHQMIVVPGLWHRMAREPALLDRVFEEALRFEAPAALLNRRCRVDTVLGDVALRAGDVVLVAVGLANRDAAVHERADEFDPARPRPEQHLSFGAGPHTCPGIPLVRLLVEAVCRPLLARFTQAPRLSADFRYQRREFFVGRGPARLDVDLPAAGQ